MVDGRDMSAGLSVRELCATIEGHIAAAFPDEVWVHGVISGITRSAQGHVYFDLVESADLGQAPDALLPVALFNSARQRVNHILRRSGAARIENGTEVKIRGGVNYFARQGRVQLVMTLIDPAYTLGRIEIAKAELLAQLDAEGVLHANRRLSFPPAPLRVALVTSAESAAHADFIHELTASHYAFSVDLFDTRVQGATAAADIAAALAAVAAASDRFDVVALVRGGGARTDLAAFDHEIVVRAITRSPLPVVVGIGHEIDSTVADEVAAQSAKTPTACARLLLETVTTFDHRLDDLGRRIRHEVTRRTRQEHERMALATHRLERTVTVLARAHEVLDRKEALIEPAARRQLDVAGNRLDQAETAAQLLDPARALARGWSIVRTADGSLLHSVSDAIAGTRVEITVADGTMGATVEASWPGGKSPS